MTKQSHAVSALPRGTFKLPPPELPLPDAAQHDEWLLDEALAETFPASDAIAVSAPAPVSDRRP